MHTSAEVSKSSGSSNKGLCHCGISVLSSTVFHPGTSGTRVKYKQGYLLETDVKWEVKEAVILSSLTWFI